MNEYIEDGIAKKNSDREQKEYSKMTEKVEQ